MGLKSLSDFGELHLGKGNSSPDFQESGMGLPLVII